MTDVSLASGVTGQLLLLGMLNRLVGEARLELEVTQERLIEGIDKIVMPLSLFGGLAGPACVGSIYSRDLGSDDANFLKIATEKLRYKLLFDIEERRKVDGEKEKNIDLINGSVGLANTLLEIGTDAELINFVVSDILNRCIGGPGNIFVTNVCGAHGGLVDLGLAHGNSGVLALLAKLMIRRPETRSTLNHVVQGMASWLISQRQDHGLSRYSYFADTKVNSRLGWCYGDLSAAIALYWAGMALAQVELLNYAIELAENSLSRPQEGSGVEDHGICHGTASLVHIYSQFYRATKRPAFAHGCELWLKQASATFLADDNPFGHNFSSPGFLEGQVGAALALLSALFPECPWAAVLLTDFPSLD